MMWALPVRLIFPRSYTERLDRMSAQMDTLNSNLAGLVAVAPKVVEVIARLSAGKEDTAGLQAANDMVAGVVAQLQGLVDANPAP